MVVEKDCPDKVGKTVEVGDEDEYENGPEREVPIRNCVDQRESLAILTHDDEL